MISKIIHTNQIFEFIKTSTWSLVCVYISWGISIGFSMYWLITISGSLNSRGSGIMVIKDWEWFTVVWAFMGADIFGSCNEYKLVILRTFLYILKLMFYSFQDRHQTLYSSKTQPKRSKNEYQNDKMMQRLILKYLTNPSRIWCMTARIWLFCWASRSCRSLQGAA